LRSEWTPRPDKIAKGLIYPYGRVTTKISDHDRSGDLDGGEHENVSVLDEAQLHLGTKKLMEMVVKTERGVLKATSSRVMKE